MTRRGIVHTFAALEALLGPLLARAQAANLECDGCTNVFHAVLTSEQVAHTVYCGRISVGEKTIAPHWWIEVAKPHAINSERPGRPTPLPGCGLRWHPGRTGWDPSHIGGRFAAPSSSRFGTSDGGRV